MFSIVSVEDLSEFSKLYAIISITPYKWSVEYTVKKVYEYTVLKYIVLHSADVLK